MGAYLGRALAYARLGWRVHPCRPREKLPLLDGWQRRATTDPTLLGLWWGRTPEANIAVATGPGSRIFVLDVDGPEGEYALIDLERRHGSLPELYPQQRTGSGHGWQAFFAWPEGCEIRNSAGRLGSKFDIRGAGGFVVLPPSVHPSGNRYQWAVDRAPGSIPPESAPAWMLDLLDAPEAPPGRERTAFSAGRYRDQAGEDRSSAWSWTEQTRALIVRKRYDSAGGEA